MVRVQVAYPAGADKWEVETAVVDVEQEVGLAEQVEVELEDFLHPRHPSHRLSPLQSAPTPKGAARTQPRLSLVLKRPRTRFLRPHVGILDAPVAAAEKV